MNRHSNASFGNGENLSVYDDRREKTFRICSKDANTLEAHHFLRHPDSQLKRRIPTEHSSDPVPARHPREMDFWIGEWDTDTLTGYMRGKLTLPHYLNSESAI